MSQSLTALYLQNPELANALRRRQEGSALYQAGSDTSPIQSPYQGLARLAQALVGGYEQGQGDKEIKAAGDLRRQQDAALFGPMTPMTPPQQPDTMLAGAPAPRQPVARRALAPADYEPLIQQASQETGIPANILTGLFAQESGFRPDARNPRSTATGIGQVLDSTAANPGYGLPPLSPEGRLDPAQAIPWSARYLAARAQGLGATDWNNPQHVERALRAYGENTPEYARGVMQRAGLETPDAGQQAPQQGALPQPRTPDASQFYMAQAQEYQTRAQRAIAAGRPEIAHLLQQQAQLAQQQALARGPQPTADERLLEAAGLRPGSPEYQAMATQLLQAKARGQNVNVTQSGGTSWATQPPADYRYVVEPTPNGGQTLRMEVIPGSKTDMALRDKEAKEGKRTEATVRAGNIVTEDIDRIGKLVATSTLPTAGPGATFLSGISGTGASDVAHLLEGIGANIAFDKLQEMRASSPTGAALGAVSDKENAMLQSVYGSLKQSQSQEQFSQNLARLKKIYMDIIHGAGKWQEVAPDAQPDATPLASPAAPAQGGGWSIRPVR